METIEQIKKRKNRELKFERILLYNEWEERGPEELHWNWEQWLKIRKLRNQFEKSRKPKYKIEYEVIKITSFGEKIKKYSWHDDDSFNQFVERIEKEYYVLQKFTTKELLFIYIHRNRHCSSHELYFEGKEFLTESFYYVLNTREHISRKHIKRFYSGKKDRNNGRKNPTNRK